MVEMITINIACLLTILIGGEHMGSEGIAGLILLVFFSIIFGIPLYMFLIYTIKNPKESFKLCNRWMFKDKDIEPSEFALDMQKIGSIIGLVLMTIGFIALLIQIF